MRDDSSNRAGQRLVVVLKRDAVARVVLNNLYKHTELQQNFSCNMLALVDDVPRTLSLDAFISNWVAHQIDVIQRRTRSLLRKAEEDAHIYRALAKALDALDEVIALIRRSQTTDEAREGLMGLLEIDELQATAILNMQLRRLAALERQSIVDRLVDLERTIADLEGILASEQRQRDIVSTELQTLVDKYGDARRSQIIPADGDLSMEDLIPDEDVVITITRGGYAKRTRADLYRLQKRGGKGVRGATLRGDDIVEHFFSSTNHHWLLFFTTAGRVYRTKAYHLPESARDAKGGHVAGLLSFQPDEQIAQVLAIRDYAQAPYLVLATRNGYVKKTRLADYDSARQAGVIAVNFREDDDELIGAELVTADDDLLLVSRKGQSVRFRADDAQLRPMGRATSGVTGMKFRAGDKLLSMSVIRSNETEPASDVPEAETDAAEPETERYVFTVTDGGYAKRTRVGEYRLQGRGGIGIKAMRLADARGSLVGAIVVTDADEVMAVRASGQVTRSAATDVPAKGRDTMGVKFVTVANGDSVVAIARNAEPNGDEESTEGVDDGSAVDLSEVESNDGSRDTGGWLTSQRTRRPRRWMRSNPNDRRRRQRPIGPSASVRRAAASATPARPAPVPIHGSDVAGSDPGDRATDRHHATTGHRGDRQDLPGPAGRTDDALGGGAGQGREVPSAGGGSRRSQGGRPPAPADPPRQAAGDPGGPVVGDQDGVPAVDRLRRDVRGRRVPGLLDHGCLGSVGQGQRDDPAGRQPGPGGPVRHQGLRRDEPRHGDHDADQRDRRGADHGAGDARRVHLQHVGGHARRHRDHPRRGPRLSPSYGDLGPCPAPAASPQPVWAACRRWGNLRPACVTRGPIAQTVRALP